MLTPVTMRTESAGADSATGEIAETMTEPRASRPHMPGYGIADATSGKGLLPWSWAVERLTKARNYWVATTRPDGNPHAMPVWGVWIDDAFYFSTGTQSRKARNLAENPRCVIGCEIGPDQVIVTDSAPAQTLLPSGHEPPPTCPAGRRPDVYLEYRARWSGR